MGHLSTLCRARLAPTGLLEALGLRVLPVLLGRWAPRVSQALWVLLVLLGRWAPRVSQALRAQLVLPEQLALRALWVRQAPLVRLVPMGQLAPLVPMACQAHQYSVRYTRFRQQYGLGP